MRRVVITGIGIVCPIGNNAAEVEASLRAGKLHCDAGVVERTLTYKHVFTTVCRSNESVTLGLVKPFQSAGSRGQVLKCWRASIASRG